MKVLRPIRLHQIKIEAKLIHKKFKSDFDTTVKNYLRLPFFKNLSSSEFEKKRKHLLLKDVYHIVASEYGFKRWEDLKQHIERNDLLFRSNGIGLIHKWFNSYSEAKKYHTKYGGYLLQFWADYVVCGNEYIQLLALQHYTEAWKAIGYNWIEPTDEQAFQKLYQQAILQYNLL
ncbi:MULTISPECIES: hypothetical protein [Aequorivita]|uniref:Uncharacterized protein n=1 Tax=Aequorivita iocasae TaxID=2803865 RepID=A0ABX7DQC5_9FLAO|nr:MULTISPECIES: hypothetical protein [Aequorivita]QQX76017.1 hypothetical protein JK629_11815 [Aequorivita iocasae]UCA55478.1 hypothetical protein LDL78_11870 [Aequorivita sp. F7]